MATSFAADIRPLFRSKDLNCMGSFGVLLGDYAYMSNAAGSSEYNDFAHARQVLDHISGDKAPRMPMGGPYWSDDNVKKLNVWIDAGCLP
jgi:hypothetical protein